MEHARRTAERTARNSYGRLLAFLAARNRNIAAAEDALADAIRAALEHWPKQGTPDNPEAWLLTVARRNLQHTSRHERVQTDAAPTLLLIAEEASEASIAAFPDERLPLLFVCAHPAIDPQVQSPLMLQTVLGLDSARIASAFLVAPATMAQRLVRAKTKIRDAGIAFALPEPADLAARLDTVLDAIYAAYGSGWDDALGADPRRKGLSEEAIWLGRVLCELLPDAAEARGLLALMLHCESRRAARRDAAGAFVPLDRQNPTHWNAAMILEAEGELRRAANARQPGRFQLEAAIQSVHAQRGITGQTNWAALAALHQALITLAPSIGAVVSHAAVLGKLGQATDGLAKLDALLPERVASYQPYWVVRGDLLARLGQIEASIAAYQRGIGLTEEPALRSFLNQQKAAISTQSDARKSPHPKA